MDPPGLYNKYRVTNEMTGVSMSGDYFVLRYDRDVHARDALAAYAESCEGSNPTLAEDLRQVLSDTRAGFIARASFIDRQSEKEHISRGSRQV